MTLNARQRTKINAALCLIHDNGYNASAVIGMANRLTQEGKDPRSAYEAALNTFLSTEPAMLPTVSKVLKLVDASDDKTVDQYDAALSAYVSTGDDTELNTLAPIIAQDSIALALRDGEITEEEAASGDIAKALGFEPGPALQEAVTAMGEQQTGQQPQAQQEGQPNQAQWRPKAQSALPQVGDVPAPQNVVNGSQVSLGGPTGFIAMGARAKIARETGPPMAPNGNAAQDS